MGGGREEGLAKEGGAVGVPSAQAPRGAGGGGAELYAPLAAAAAASSLCVLLLGRLFLGRFGKLLIWASVCRRLALKVF